MTIQELIEDIKLACGNNLNREVIFHGLVEFSVQDDWKEFPVQFSDARIVTQHPNEVRIFLTNP